MSADNPILVASNLYKTYRLGRVAVPVLKGVSLEVRRGECLAVLGASGSGKSTLLHLLGALDRPDRGVVACVRCGYSTKGLKSQVCPECGGPSPRQEQKSSIEFEGRELSRLSSRELDTYRARSVGFIFQLYHLFPELNVMENVLIAAMARDGIGYLAGRSKATAYAKSLLERVGLGHRLRHRPIELSGGERQRVAIARALINRPTLLLADEPTGNLDRATGNSILDLLAEFHDRDRQTLVVVTHDPETARRADRVVRIEDGRLVSALRPAEPEPRGPAPVVQVADRTVPSGS